MHVVVALDTRADINAVVGQLCHVVIGIREADIIPAEVVDGQRRRIAVELYADCRRTVARIELTQLLCALGGDGLAVETDDRLVLCGIVVEHLNEACHSVLHAECGDDKHDAAQHSEERHSRSCFMAQGVAGVPFKAEAELLPCAAVLPCERLEALRRIRTQCIRGCIAERLTDGEPSDGGYKQIDDDEYYPNKGGAVERPVDKVGIRAHRAVRVHDIPCHKNAEADAEQRSDKSDGGRIRGVVRRYAAVTVAERLKGAYLRLFLCRYTVHGGDHGENGDGKEEHGQHESHCFALVRLAECLTVRRVFVLREHEQSFSERLFRTLDELGLIEVGDYVQLGIKLGAEAAPQHCG